MNEIVKKNAIKYGVISGVIGILVTTAMYVIDYSLFANIFIGFGLIIVFIIIGCIQLINTKKENGGVLTFKDGFVGYFVGAVIGILISNLYSLVLFNFIDKEAASQISEVIINKQAEQLKSFNVPKDKIKETIKALKENPQFSIKSILLGLPWAFVGSAVFGLILAAIFKSRSNNSLNE